MDIDPEDQSNWRSYDIIMSENISLVQSIFKSRIYYSEENNLSKSKYLILT